jgi:hypothetical protein
MRIGVVCEGPTDYFAVVSFFGHALKEEGIQAEFVSLQPQMDQTRPPGGWGNVLSWFDRNPPSLRIQQHFGGGFFGGSLGTPPLNALLIQLDCDVLGERPFSDYVQKTYGMTLGNPADEGERAGEIRRMLEVVAKFSDMTEGDIGRHVVAPAVEATESWCVAAFTTPTPNCEALRGQALVDAFMTALERSEGRLPTPPYANTDKNPARREAFCKKHAQGSDRVRSGCAHFEQAFQQLNGNS